jgi:hypothetical protein
MAAFIVGFVPGYLSIAVVFALPRLADLVLGVRDELSPTSIARLVTVCVLGVAFLILVGAVTISWGDWLRWMRPQGDEMPLGPSWAAGVFLGMITYAVLPTIGASRKEKIPPRTR